MCSRSLTRIRTQYILCVDACITIYDVIQTRNPILDWQSSTLVNVTVTFVECSIYTNTVTLNVAKFSKGITTRRFPFVYGQRGSVKFYFIYFIYNGTSPKRLELFSKISTYYYNMVTNIHNYFTK